MEPKDKKGQEIECYLSGLFPICYLYLQRKPELSEQLVGEMEHHEIPSCVGIAGLPCPGPASTVTPRPGALAPEYGTDAH